MNQMLRSTLRQLAILGAVAAAPVILPAQTWSATLLGSNEVPPTGSTGGGTIKVVLASNILTVTESYFGLTGPATGAHIHCCAAAGVNAAIAVPFTNFPAAAAGSYTQTFDLTQSVSFTSAFLTANGGTAASGQAALVAGLNAGLAYANIHDAAFAGGEVRGQLAVVTPEPGTVALTAAGLLALVVAARKRESPRVI